MIIRNLTLFIVAVLFAGCSPREGRKNFTRAGNNNEYSKNFLIRDSSSYTRLVVYDPWQGADNTTFTYYITDSLSYLPRGIDRSKAIVRPVDKIVCTSTTHIAFLDTLGAVEKIEAVSGTDYIYDNKLREKIMSGEVADIGHENGYNTELIYNIDPDVVLVYGVGSESASIFSRLIELGIPVLFVADYLEEHPLARTEWIKVFGEILNRRKLADSIFSSVVEEYTAISKRVRDTENKKPLVFLGLPFNDKWFVSPGNSYMAQLIEDAGGEYLWDHLHSGMSVPMSLEAVCHEAVKADIWLNPGSVTRISEIESVDERLGELPALREGSVHNNNRRINEYGGNDYWESGTVNPHILLKDIASIINPALFPGYRPSYYISLKDK